MVGRVRVVAAAVAGLVLLAGAVGCGDDATKDEAVHYSANYDPASTTTTAPPAGGVKPGPQAGEPALTGAIATVSSLEQTQECDASDPVASPDDAVSSDDTPTGCAKASGLLGAFVVEDGTDAKGAALAASVTVPDDIAILREDGAGGYALASFDDLAEGTSVQVWFDGPVAESYPVHATASSVVIEA
jgi:hypothetical protein